MATLSQITASPVPLIIKKVNPSTGEVTEINYLFSPLDDKDLGEFENWLKIRYLDLVKQQIADLEPEERRQQLESALRYASKITISGEDANSAQQSFSGIKYLAYLSLRHNKPDISTDEVGQLLTDPKISEQIKERMALANSGGSQENPLKAPIQLGENHQ